MEIKQYKKNIIIIEILDSKENLKMENSNKR
jgi:hypothetical protein